MKIKITLPLCGDPAFTPQQGEVYEVIRKQGNWYIIDMQGMEVGVASHECEVVDDD